MMSNGPPPAVTYVLAGGLGIALLAIGYLLGRSPAPATAPTAGASPSRVDYGEPPPARAEGRSAERVIAGNPPPGYRREAPPPITAPPNTAPPSPRYPEPLPTEPGSEPSDADAVARYFDEVEALQAGPSGSSPRGFAEELIGGALQGDTSGIDRLISDLKKNRDKLQRLSVPSDCRHFHRQMGESIGQSIAIMGPMRDALASGDTSRMTAVVGEANALQAKVQALEAEKRRIKRRYGLR